jgi:hypothetical protein
VVFTDRFPPVHEVYLGEFLEARFAAERVVLLDTRSVALLEEKTLDLRVNIKCYVVSEDDQLEGEDFG